VAITETITMSRAIKTHDHGVVWEIDGELFFYMNKQPGKVIIVKLSLFGEGE